MQSDPERALRLGTAGAGPLIPSPRHLWLYLLAIDRDCTPPAAVLLVGACCTETGDVRYSRLDLRTLKQGQDIVGAANFESAIAAAVYRDLRAQGVDFPERDPVGTSPDVV